LITGLGIALLVLTSVAVITGSFIFCRRRTKQNIRKKSAIRQFNQGIPPETSELIEMTESAIGFSVAMKLTYDSKYEIRREHIIFGT